MRGRELLEESFYHYLLSKEREFRPGSIKGDRNLRSALAKEKSFRNVYRAVFGSVLFNDDFDRWVRKFDWDFQMVRISDPEFPEFFSSHENTSPVLYFKGDFSLLKRKTIAVVGTRRLDDEEDITEGKKILERLLEKDYVIVSGLAKGCDTLAHRYAIDNGGKTIAVLGNPLSVYYPAENRKLQELIEEEGLVISQYPFGIRTFPSHYAHRNTTTVGLSKEGIVVIKSGDNSGTIHAIKQAYLQNKPIYVLRGNFVHGYNWVEKYKDRIKIPNQVNFRRRN